MPKNKNAFFSMSSAAAAFDDLGVLPEIIKAVDEQGWTLPTSIQAESIPLILGGGDVMAVFR